MRKKTSYHQMAIHLWMAQIKSVRTDSEKTSDTNSYSANSRITTETILCSLLAMYATTKTKTSEGSNLSGEQWSIAS